ncbi:hypothetical protein, partial [Cupriavidus taiwanensis]|uniref:hypothetical protein n=1 Tax=Cupriavidus taiwanensis TaxID=164546 RepID=UPI002161CDC1
ERLFLFWRTPQKPACSFPESDGSCYKYQLGHFRWISASFRGRLRSLPSGDRSALWESEMDLVTLYQHLFSSDRRLYGLDGNAPVGDLSIEAWIDSEPISAQFEWHIMAVSANPDIALDPGRSTRHAVDHARWQQPVTPHRTDPPSRKSWRGRHFRALPTDCSSST